jgi:hypothetical protein
MVLDLDKNVAVADVYGECLHRPDRGELHSATSAYVELGSVIDAL